MKAILTAAALCALSAGCALNAPQGGEQVAQEERYTPTGTMIPRKKGEGAAPVGNVDKTQLENERTMQSGSAQSPTA